MARQWLNEVGDVISHAATVVERFTPMSADARFSEATVSDPIVFTRPWTIAMPLRRNQNGELLEVACLEDNQDLLHLKDVRDGATNNETDVLARLTSAPPGVLRVGPRQPRLRIIRLRRSSTSTSR